MTPGPWDLVADAATAISRATGIERHDVLVVLGSGWAPAADRFGTTVAEVPVDELPGFPSVDVAGHAGMLRSIEGAGGRRILALLGRVHAYEGHDLTSVVHAVRASVRGGCGTVVVTNAAGGPPLRSARRPARADQRPHQPDRTVAPHRAAGTRVAGTAPVPGPHRRLLAPAPGPGPRGRPHPGGGRVRRAPGPAVRDAGRDPDAADRRRRPGRHVDGARGHRRPARRAPRCWGSRWSPTSPPAWGPPTSTTPTSWPRVRPPPRRWASCWPRSSVACDRRRAPRPGDGLARRGPGPRHPSRARRPARSRRPGRAPGSVRGAPAVRYRRSAGRAGGRPEPDEPGPGAPSHGRGGRVAAGAGRGRRGRGRTGRPPPQPGLLRRHGCGAGRGRLRRPGAPAPAADPGARLRDPARRRGGRDHDHGQPQPAGGQRLQAVPRRRRPDRVARRRRDLGRRSTRSARWPTCRSAMR